MTTPSPSRLERALAIYLQTTSNGGGGDVDAVLREHDDLRDLLEPLLRPDALPPEPVEAIGDFELVRELGRGGMGVVHEARQRSLGRRVALKLLAPHVAADPARLARFRREAVTLARVEHPHVVRVFDAGETDGRHWLAMELVDGEALDARLRRLAAAGGHHDGSLRELVQVVHTIAGALVHLHAAGVVHRDVKPSNILLADDGRACLSDFGLARPDDSSPLTADGVLAGTPHYLPPEYVATGAATPAGDVWSLGATLYECVALARPFDGPDDGVVLRRIVHDEPLDPRRHRPGLPADLAAIVLRALEKDPARRYPSMAALADDLQAFLDLRPTVARPPALAVRARRWLRREPLRGAVLGLLLVAAGLGAFVLLRLPTLRAGERAAAAAAYETAVTDAFLRRSEADAEAAAAAAAQALALRPDAGEAIVVAVLVHLRRHGAAPALAELDRLAARPHDDDEGCRWLRVLLLGRLARRAEADALATELGEPRSQMALLMAAGWLVDVQNVAANGGDTRGAGAANVGRASAASAGPDEAGAGARIASAGSVGPGPVAVPGAASAGGLARARQLASRATRIGPPRLLVHAQWATLAEPRERDECAATLLQLWPDHPQALHHAASHVQFAAPARAVALQQRALALGLRDSFARYNLAMYAHRAGDRELAVATARELLAEPLPPERQRALLQLLGDLAPEQVEPLLAAWCERAPGDALPQRELGWHLFGRGDAARALPALERAVAAAPDDARSLQGLALVLQELDDAPASLPIADRMLASDPASAAGHALRLHALRATAAPAAAVLAELRRAAAARPADAAVWCALADALLDQPDAAGWPEALRAAQQAQRCGEPDDPAALAVLARAHAALGEPAAAAAARARLGGQRPR